MIISLWKKNQDKKDYILQNTCEDAKRKKEDKEDK